MGDGGDHARAGDGSTLHEASAGYLREYVRRLERAVAVLPETDTWWKPHAGALSVGNILVHLEGNVRQWILSGIGSEADERDRASEFAREEGAGAEELVAELRRTVESAARLIENLDEEARARTYSIQGSEVQGWWAVLHVVEHFSWHTGQAVWIAKARAGSGHGLAFFDDARVNRARNG